MSLTNSSAMDPSCLVLLRLHRQAIACGWTPDAYRSIADWCVIHAQGEAQRWESFSLAVEDLNNPHRAQGVQP